MKHPLTRLGLTALALVSGPVLVAQTITTGAISGTVTESNGNPIAAATVTLSSGQITRTAITGADGRFQAGLLNAGGWQLTVAKAGFITGKQKVSVNINASSTANFKLGKEGGATVEVIATASTIDTTSTTTGANFALDNLKDIPTGRDIGDVAFMTPGVSFSGFNNSQGASANLGLNIAIAGASGAENSFSVDGLRTNDMRYGGQGVSMSQNFVDQIEIQTGGYKPEYSAMGGVFNVTTKSGTNNFSGSAWADLSPGSMSPGPKSNAFFGETKAVDIYEIGALASGAIVKDKFFYAVGINWLQTNTPATPNLEGINNGAIKTPDYQFFAKFNYFINTDNQLTLSYFGSQQTATQDDAASTLLSVGNGTQLDGNATKDNSGNFSLIWDSTLAPNFTMSVKLGQATRLNQVTPDQDIRELADYTYWDGPVTGLNYSFPGGAGYLANPSGSNTNTNTKWYSGGYGANNKETDALKQASIDFTWILGSHSVKGGFSDMTSRYEEHDHRSGPDSSVWYTNIDSSTLASHAATQGSLEISQRLYANDSVANAEFQALYLQDTWEVNKGLNVFYGARAEHQLQKGNNGQAFMDFGFGKYIQPRLGFTWDIKGDATSKISGSYAIYYEQIPQRMAIRTYGNENYFRYNYYGAGYTGPTLAWTPTAATDPWSLVAGQTPVLAANYSLGWSHDPIADNVKLPQRQEFKLGYDQQVSTTTTLGIHGTYRKLTNPLEDSEIGYWDPTLNSKGIPNGWTPSDPADNVGGQAIIWNPGGSVSWTSPFNGQKVSVSNTGYPKAYNEYKAIELSYTYKTSTDMLYVGYTWSRNYGNYEGLISPSNGQADGNITASFDYPPYVGTGLLPIDKTHEIKAYGFHKITVGAKDFMTLGFNFLAQSGTPISLQDDGSVSAGQLPGYNTANLAANPGDPGGYGNSSFANGQMGQYGRTQFLTKLDLNLNYTHPISSTMSLSCYIQIYNVYNYRPSTQVFEQATDNLGNAEPTGMWKSPETWQAPRSFRFGAKLQF